MSLYERDFHAWALDQAAKLRARAHGGIDWENVAEEIESLGRSDKREIRSRLGRLMLHLLKWEFQPERRKAGWRSTIREQRQRIRDLIEESPSLREYPQSEAAREYALARLKAADETGLAASVFPAECPYRMADILDDDFFPGGSSSPEDLVRD